MKTRQIAHCVCLVLSAGLSLGPVAATADVLIDAYILVREGNADNAQIGYSVATAGDVNGDGYSDVLLNGAENNGTVWCYHGGAVPDFTTPAWTANGGDQLNAWLNCRVSTAGDVNADGYDDALVGARLYANGEANEGAVFVYLGSSAGLSTTPHRVIEGNLAGGAFGSDVDAAGDVNGDGYDDIVIGSKDYSNGQSFEGRAQVYLGSADGISSTPLWSFESDVAYAYFGTQVAGTLDVNADGYDDVLVSAPDLANGQSGEGRVYLFLGSSSGPAVSPSWTYESGIVGGRAGWGLGCAGDVNGDGYADIVFDVGTNNPAFGAVLAFFGGASGPGANADRSFSSNQGAFGDRVYTAGDVNGDGFSDLIAGESSYGGSMGRILVLGGTESGSVFPALAERWGDQAGEQFSVDCAPAGDVNGDGFGDVISGAPLYDNGQTNEGAVRLHLGRAAMPNTSAAWNVDGVQDGSWFGASVAQGDWNGDGYADLAVGYPYYDLDGIDAGAVVVYYGGVTGYTIAANLFLSGSHDGGLFGHALANAGDIDNDGCEELIVGEPYYGTFDYPHIGAVHIFKGTTSGLESTPWWYQSGGIEPGAFGYAVSGAGDVNGDGYADVVVSAPFLEFPPFEEGGAVFLYLGSATGLSTSAVWTGFGGEYDDWFGYDVAGVGDTNGDGFGEIAVGAPHRESSAGEDSEGVVWVFFGSASGINGGWSVEGNQAAAQFGFCVAAGGDINGDGLSDVLHGAPYFDGEGKPDCGLVEAYLGTASQTLDPSFHYEGIFAGDWTGWAVAGGGDVNGDGYSDIAIGTILYDFLGTDAGWVAVRLGGPNGIDPYAIGNHLGTDPGGMYGFAVSLSGDVTGDGFADLIVGQPRYLAEYGRAYCFYGAREGMIAPEDGSRRIPGQFRADWSTPIQPLGASDDPGGFNMRMLARSARGRSTLQVEYQIAQAGSPWSGDPISGGSLDTGVPSPGFGSAEMVNLTASGLDSETAYRWRMRFLGDSPYFPMSQWFSVAGNGPGETDVRTGVGPVDVADDGAFGAGDDPATFGFSRVEPNPSRGRATLRFVLPKAGAVQLAVYDVAGRRVAALLDEAMPAGAQAATWDTRDARGRPAPAGVYFLRLTYGGGESIARLIVQR
jgi:hypothetical protein